MERRDVLKGFMVGAALLAVPWATQALFASARSSRASLPGPSPWDVVAPMTRGTYVGAGWTVADLSAVRDGALVLTLAHATGERAEVHMCRRRQPSQGIARTAHLDLFLMNGGNGEQPTAEGVGRAVKTVAMRIAAHERRAAEPFAAPSGLMSHEGRLRWFGPPEIAV